jgi:hypothetical protein
METTTRDSPTTDFAIEDDNLAVSDIGFHTLNQPSITNNTLANNSSSASSASSTETVKNISVLQNNDYPVSFPFMLHSSSRG